MKVSEIKESIGKASVGGYVRLTLDIEGHDGKASFKISGFYDEAIKFPSLSSAVEFFKNTKPNETIED